MTLPLPNLDTRDFRSLVEEARARIPTFTGEWTNFNDSDPGMTLVQLHAWLTETLLYQVNRLPDLAYISVLNLLGTSLDPARAAQAELSFRFADLDRAGDPLSILVPKGVQVGVDDPNLAAPVTFETNETLRGINATVAAILVPDEVSGGVRIVGEYDVDEARLQVPQPFRPFGSALSPAEMRVGLLLRPVRDDDQDYFLDRFPEGELDIAVFTPEVFDIDADGETIAGPFGMECLFPWEVDDISDRVSWQAYVGSDPSVDFELDSSWAALTVRGDDSGGLARSGHLYLEMPANLPTVPLSRLLRDAWTELGLTKAPTTNAELIDDLENGVFVAPDLGLTVWKDQLGLLDPQLQDLAALVDAIAAAPALDFEAVREQSWTDVGYSPSPVPLAMVWVRARTSAELEVAPQVAGLHLNTTRATAATTRSSEVLGTSAGRPNQTFTLKRAPVLIDAQTGEPTLTIEVVDSTGTRREAWERGIDFYGASRDSKRFVLDPDTGVVRFGDGVNGMIPVAGSRVLATQYRVGGGAIGNVAPNTITALKTALPQVKEVTNLRRAWGGSDVESLEQAKLRAPQLLRTRDRAVSADDFADLAMRTPGVDLKSAYALPLTALDRSTTPPTMITDVAGAVTIVVLPNRDQPTPQPSDADMRLICAYLNERRLITTELHVVGPQYLDITELRVDVLARPDADLKTVQDRCRSALERYFHPLTGGEAAPGAEFGPGWPIGGDIYVGNVFDQLLSQEGVARVVDLSIGTSSQPADMCLDVLTVEPGTLVHLPGGVLSIDVRYDRGR